MCYALGTDRGEPWPAVAVGAVVVRDGALLLVLRSKCPGAGRWSLPGGRMQAGESLDEAVIRETLEETGIRVTVGELCGVAERRSHTSHYVIVDYWAGISEGETAVAGDDAAAVRWANKADFDRLELVDGLLDFLTDHGVMDALE